MKDDDRKTERFEIIEGADEREMIGRHLIDFVSPNVPRIQEYYGIDLQMTSRWAADH